MKFGQFNLMTLPDRSCSQARVIDEAATMVRMADQIPQFDIAWFAEHHYSNYSMCPSPLMMASKCAGLTERIKLGPAVLVLPLYHPVRVAEEIAFLDLLSGGRSVIGFGSGYQEFEFTGFGLDIEDKLTAFHECWDVIERALRDGVIGIDGKSFQLPDRPMVLDLAQDKMPPVFVAGTNSSLVERVAKSGYTTLMSPGFQGLEKMQDLRNQVDQGYRAAGVDPDGAKIAIHRYIHITEDKREAQEAAECIRFIARTISTMVQGTPNMDGPFITPDPFEGEPSLDGILENANVGDPETVAQKMAAEIRIARPHHYSCFFAIGPMEGARAIRSMERFATEVIPLLEKELGDLETLYEPAAGAVAAE